jgi:hypothetical protein
MAFIVKGPAVCNKPGCGKCWNVDPILLVPCPDCHAPAGVGCRRPSGHSGPFVELHAARDLLADRAGKYDPCPLGLCGLAARDRQSTLPLFD